MNVLVINAGSSSIKYQLINIKNQKVIAKGLVERISIDNGVITHQYISNHNIDFTKKVIKQDFPSHEEGMLLISKLLTDNEIGVIKDPSEIKAVGHRVVHGGTFTHPQVITKEVIEEIKKLIPLAPLHNPAHIQGIEVAQKVFNQATHVAVFDTAFHQTMPPKAFMYAIPEKYYTDYGIRRYGFHGTSHEYVYKKAKEYLKNPKLKAITIHLGNGSSMSAINEKGKSIDTSMGLGPLAGLIMGTRSGDIDPTILLFFGEQLNYSIQEISNILNKQSGLLGLTGSSDCRDVVNKMLTGDKNSKLCMEMIAYRIQKYIGSYLAVLNGADAIIFTAGIGENDIHTRSMVCNNLIYFGIEIDETLNKKHNHPSTVSEIQAENSKIKILVIPTNEELEIATQTYEIVKNNLK